MPLAGHGPISFRAVSQKREQPNIYSLLSRSALRPISTFSMRDGGASPAVIVVSRLQGLGISHCTLSTSPKLPLYDTDSRSFAQCSFLAGQMHVLRPGTDLGRFLISLVPLMGAALIAMSRLADYRHDVYDVSCGTLLGLVVAYFSYRRYYPSLRSVHCDVPYSRSDAGGFAKLADDEERHMQGSRPRSREWGSADETHPLTEISSSRLP